MAEMMTSAETFPVIICNLPKNYFPEVKDVEIHVKNTLTQVSDKKAQAPSGDRQLPSKAKSSKNQKKDPQKRNPVLPPGTVRHIYFPVHRGVLVPTKTFGEISDQDVNDDTHCDAVVDFCSEKAQEVFCERSTHFQVGPLSKVPRKLAIEFMISDYNMNEGHIREIAKECGLLVKQSGTGIYKMKGKGWQMRIAEDLIHRESNTGEKLDPVEVKSGEEDSCDDNHVSHGDQNDDTENRKHRQKDRTHPPAEVRCHSEGNVAENLHPIEGRCEEGYPGDDNQDSHSDNNDKQPPGQNDDSENDNTREKDVAHPPATVRCHSKSETENDPESGSGNEAKSSGHPFAAEKKISTTEEEQDQMNDDPTGMNTEPQPLTNPCPNGEETGNNEQDVLQDTENRISMDTPPANEKEVMSESRSRTVSEHESKDNADSEDSEDVEDAPIPSSVLSPKIQQKKTAPNEKAAMTESLAGTDAGHDSEDSEQDAPMPSRVLSPRTQQKANQINRDSSGKNLVQAEQVTTTETIDKVQDKALSTDRTVEEKTHSVQNEIPSAEKAKEKKTNSVQAKTPHANQNKKEKRKNTTMKGDSSQDERQHCQSTNGASKADNLQRLQHSPASKQSVGMKDEPSDKEENQSSGICGKGLKRKTIDDGQYKVQHTVNPVFWAYIKSHEDGFWKKLNATCHENDVHIPEPDTDGIINIRGPDEKKVKMIKKQFCDAYDGFEFNLEERNMTSFINKNKYNEETLERQFPKILFRRTDTGDILAVGLNSELQQCIEVLKGKTQAGNHSTAEDVQMVEEKNNPIKHQRYNNSQSSFKSTNPASKTNAVTGQGTPHKGATYVSVSAYSLSNCSPLAQQVKSGTIPVEKNILAYIRRFYSSDLKEVISSGSLKTAGRNDSVDVWFTAEHQKTADECRVAFLALYLQTKDQIILEELNPTSRIPDKVMKQLEDLPCIKNTREDGIIEITCDRNVRGELFRIVSGYIMRIGKRPRERILKDTSSEEKIVKPASPFSDAANSSHPAQHNDLSYPCGFRLYDHTEVYIHKCSITNLMVDGIVNAANAPLQHGGGIAKVIADAAGPSLTEEGYAYIRRHGDLQDSEVAVTTAGWLPCKKVIHAVGPQWPHRPNKRNKDQCIALLKATFLNVLERCSQENFRSVAIPAISSGVYRVPLEHVADCMCSAMVEGLSGRTSLQEVHLIDISDQMLHLITQKFARRLPDKSMSPTDLILLPGKEVEDKINKQKITLPAGFCLHGRVSVYIHKCDITVLNVDAIVNPTDNQLRHYSGLSAQIAKAAGKTMFSECQARLHEHQGQVFDSGVVVTSGGGRLICRYVFHVVPPKWPSNRYNTGSIQTERDTCWKFLELTYINILTAAGNYGVKTIALPPVGTGFHGVPADLVAQIICEKILEHTKTETFPTSIHLVDFSSEIVLNLVIKELKAADPSMVEAIDKNRVAMFLGGGITKPAMHRQYSPPVHSPGGPGSKQSGWDDFENTPTSSVRDSMWEGVSSQSSGVRSKQSGWDGFANKPCASVTDSPDWDGSSVDHDVDSQSSTGGNTPRGARPKMNKPSTGGRGTSQGANNGPHSSSFRHNHRTNPTNSSSSGKDKYKGQDSRTGTGSDSGTMKKDDCCICLSAVTAPKVLPCKHVFCTDCIDESFRSCGPRCPVCGQLHGVLKGTQPDGGKMVVRKHRLSIPGYEGCGAIVIDYDIPDGTQNAEHPNPGKRYFGTHRTAYLPNNQEGNEILHLLQRAFDNRLIFTIGRSSTTGQEDQVTWNDIHHKTSVNGRYGYPDPGYLQRVRQELADKGIK